MVPMYKCLYTDTPIPWLASCKTFVAKLKSAKGDTNTGQLLKIKLPSTPHLLICMWSSVTVSIKDGHNIPFIINNEHFTFFHTHASLLKFFVCFMVLFHSSYSHACVFGKTLVHECMNLPFPITIYCDGFEFRII